MPTLTTSFFILSTVVFPLSLLTLPTLNAAHPNPLPQSSGLPSSTAKMTVYHTADADSLTRGESAGCLDASGRLIADTTQCAVYTLDLTDGKPHIAHTSAGECGFNWPDEPANPDDNGAHRTWSAFRCKDSATQLTTADQLAPTLGNGLWYVTTEQGSGVNWKIYSKGLPGQNGNGDAVDVFTRAQVLAQGSVDLLWFWETAGG